MQGIEVYMCEELHQAFKIRCLVEGRLMQDVASELLREYLKDTKNTKAEFVR